MMLLSEIKKLLPTLHNVAFQMENGEQVPEHFHVTEVGIIERRFIDCGGILRHERTVNFQLWDANDYDHRLKPGKLLHIISLSEEKLGIQDDLLVEVEYQSTTIGRYNLEFDNNTFILRNKITTCLAPDQCGVSVEKKKIPLAVLGKPKSNCLPGSGCC